MYCKAEATALNRRLLKQDNKAQLIHVTCNKCNGSLLAVILNNGTIIQSVGLKTDLNHIEAKQHFIKEYIDSDEIISIHELLNHEDSTNLLLNT